MDEPSQGKRWRDFVQTAIASPQATSDSISFTPDDYPLLLQPTVFQLHQALQSFLRDLHNGGINGSVNEKLDSSLEGPVAAAPCAPDIPARATSRAQPMVPEDNPSSAVCDGHIDAGSQIVAGPSSTAEPACVYSPPTPLETRKRAAPTVDNIRSDTEESVLRLYPTRSQYSDFPSLLKCAQELGAEQVGVFKVVLPEDMPQAFARVDNDDCPVSVFAATKKTNGIFQLSREAQRASLQMDADVDVATVTTAQALERFEAVLEDKAGLDGAVYCTDHDARTTQDRHELGLPEQSPIWPFAGNELDRTAKYVPGLHHPFAYKSGTHFGAPFALHKEDCDLVSLNVLYFGCKVWTVVAHQHASLVEQQHKSIWRHRYTCAQSLRHCSTWVFPRTLTEWGANTVTLRQQPNEVVVVYAGAYHQGFCVGATLGEAVNYAPLGWSIAGYAGCSAQCPGHPIPNAYMEFRRPDELQQGRDETDSEQNDDPQSDPEDESECEYSEGEERPTASLLKSAKSIAETNLDHSNASTRRKKRTRPSAP